MVPMRDGIRLAAVRHQSEHGEPEGAWTTTRVAMNTVLVDAAHASHVVLPTVGD